ncbi:hypothetical protein F4677DRAFT_423310 [Hypoxylon crocopeplum]|nr:hypothetical protein F4677DRAFT_423310 [Hypoxylon crocopeplum]
MSLALAPESDWLLCLWPPCQRDNAQLKRDEHHHPSSTYRPFTARQTPNFSAVIEHPMKLTMLGGCPLLRGISF